MGGLKFTSSGVPYVSIKKHISSSLSKRDKVLAYLTTFGITKRNVLINDLSEVFNISKSSVGDAIRHLFGKKTITKPKRGYYQFGNIIKIVPRKIKSGTTHGSGISHGTKIYDSEIDQVFKLWDIYPRMHNIQGYISVRDFGTFGKFNGRSHTETLVIDPVVGSYVKLMRQGDNLQFFMANQRPGFHRFQINECMVALDKLLETYDIRGSTWYHQIEFRSMDSGPIIADLKENPIEEKIIEGYLVRIYIDDEDRLNKELRVYDPYGIGWDRSQLITMINRLSDGIHLLSNASIMQSGVDKMVNEMEVSNRNMKQLFHSSIDFITEATDEVSKIKMESHQINYSLSKMDMVVNNQKKSIEKLHFGIHEINELVKRNTGNINSDDRPSVFSDPEVQLLFIKQNEILLNQNLLISGIAKELHLIKEEIRETKEEVKSLRIEQSDWRLLDNQARLELIHELKNLGKSWSQVGDYLTTVKSTPYKFHAKYCIDKNCGHKKRKPSPEVCECVCKIHKTNGCHNKSEVDISHYEYLKDEFSVSNSFSHRKQIMLVLKKLGSSTASEMCNILYHLPGPSIRSCLSKMILNSIATTSIDGIGKNSVKRYHYIGNGVY